MKIRAVFFVGDDDHHATAEQLEEIRNHIIIFSSPSEIEADTLVASHTLLPEELKEFFPEETS